VIIYGLGEDFSQTYIVCVSLYEGVIHYYVDTPGPFKTIHEETYEEGLEIVKKACKSL